MRRFISLVSLVPVVAGASVLSILGLAAVRSLVPTDLLVDSADAVGDTLQTVGTIYAVLLAFVVATVWAQFNETRTLIEAEANDLLDLFRSADGFLDGERREVQDGLARYVDRVLAEEWPAMAAADPDVPEQVGAELDAVWVALHALQPHNDCARALHAEALSRYGQLTDARTRRLSSGAARIPFPLQVLLYQGGLIVVGAMYLFSITSFTIHAIMTGAVAGAVSHVLYIIWDLDNPFAGAWQLSPAPFERVRRSIARRRDRAPAVAFGE